MKIFVLLLALLGVAQSYDTLEEMQGNLTREVMITHYPAILKMLKDTIPPFYAEAKTALSKQLSETINTLNRYNLNEPFIDFYNFFHDCVEGLGDVKTYLNKVASNAELNEKVKVAFEELNQAINSTFGEAIEKFNDEPCQTRIIRNMGAFTDEVDANITDWINFVTKAFGEDSANERNHMKKIYESFQLNVTQCTVKPLATSKPCLLSLLKEKGPNVVAYSANLGIFIFDLINRLLKNVKAEMALTAYYMEIRYPKAFNVPCLIERT